MNSILHFSFKHYRISLVFVYAYFTDLNSYISSSGTNWISQIPHCLSQNPKMSWIAFTHSNYFVCCQYTCSGSLLKLAKLRFCPQFIRRDFYLLKKRLYQEVIFIFVSFTDLFIVFSFFKRWYHFLSLLFVFF